MISIHRATVSDVDDLVGLVESYRAFYKQAVNPATRDYLVQRIERDEAVIFLATYNDDFNNSPAGFTMMYPTFSTVSLSHIWLLNDLFVDDKYRGHGIASQLMDVAEQAARAAGATRLFLRTAHDNTPAQTLYEARGWVQDSVFRRYDLIF